MRLPMDLHEHRARKRPGFCNFTTWRFNSAQSMERFARALGAAYNPADFGVRNARWSAR